MMDIHITEEDQVVFDRLKSSGRITRSLKKLMVNRWNRCSICHSEVSHGRPTFGGYNKDGEAIFVGACCALELAELASPTYAGITHTLNISISDEISVWRYMDFAKFVAMMTQNGLYFSRLDALDDLFEGATGLAKREEDWDRFYLEFFRSAVKYPPSGVSTVDYTSEYIEGEAQRLLKDWKSAGRRSRSSFVSCWHANTGESEALWRLYCPPATAGVAVRTTVGALWEATESESSSVVGRVHYLDFRKRFADPQPDYKVFCKRASLSHENEVRIAIIDKIDIPASGKIVSSDLNKLIHGVVVSPFSPPWFEGVLKETISNFGFEFDVRTSDLLEQPFF